MKDRQSEQTSEWQKTKFANLVRFRSSDTLFARFKARGKLVRQALDTNDLEVGKRKLDDLMRQERGTAEHKRDGKMTVADAFVEFRERGYRVSVTGRTKRKTKPLKQRTKDYYEERVKALCKSWPGLEKLAIRSNRDKEWSVTDCASLNIMREIGITEALTNDRHFQQSGYTALLREAD
jgi:hypothetical protein